MAEYSDTTKLGETKTCAFDDGNNGVAWVPLKRMLWGVVYDIKIFVDTLQGTITYPTLGKGKLSFQEISNRTHWTDP